MKVFPDYGGLLPVWPGPRNWEGLITRRLRRDLLAWKRVWDDRPDPFGDGPWPETSAWAADGGPLVERLQQELGPVFSVRLEIGPDASHGMGE